jgi:hypothetical protein
VQTSTKRTLTQTSGAKQAVDTAVKSTARDRTDHRFARAAGTFSAIRHSSLHSRRDRDFVETCHTHERCDNTPASASVGARATDQ